MKRYVLFLLVIFASCTVGGNQEKVLGIRYMDCISGYEIDTENDYRCYRSQGWVKDLDLKEGDLITVFENEKIK